MWPSQRLDLNKVYTFYYKDKMRIGKCVEIRGSGYDITYLFKWRGKYKRFYGNEMLNVKRVGLIDRVINFFLGNLEERIA